MDNAQKVQRLEVEDSLHKLETRMASCMQSLDQQQNSMSEANANYKNELFAKLQKVEQNFLGLFADKSHFLELLAQQMQSLLNSHCACHRDKGKDDFDYKLLSSQQEGCAKSVK